MFSENHSMNASLDFLYFNLIVLLCKFERFIKEFFFFLPKTTFVSYFIEFFEFDTSYSSKLNVFIHMCILELK